MKTSLIIAAFVATTIAGAIAGAGPAYQGQTASRTVVAASADSTKCLAMQDQTASGKTPVTGMNCSAPSVKASAKCRAHCG